MVIGLGDHQSVAFRIEVFRLGTFIEGLGHVVGHLGVVDVRFPGGLQVGETKLRGIVQVVLPPLLQKKDAPLQEGFTGVRRLSHRLVELDEGLARIVLRRKGLSQVDMGLGPVGVDPHRLVQQMISLLLPGMI